MIETREAGLGRKVLFLPSEEEKATKGNVASRVRGLAVQWY